MSVTERTLIRFLSLVFLKNAGGAQGRHQKSKEKKHREFAVGGKSDLKKFLIDFQNFKNRLFR